MLPVTLPPFLIVTSLPPVSVILPTTAPLSSILKAPLFVVMLPLITPPFFTISVSPAAIVWSPSTGVVIVFSVAV